MSHPSSIFQNDDEIAQHCVPLDGLYHELRDRFELRRFEKVNLAPEIDRARGKFLET
jgi:hypothetical protein